MQNLQIVNKKRDRLFYDKYEYSISFLVPFSATLRGCTKPSFLNVNIETRTRLRYKYYRNSNKSYTGFGWITTLNTVDLDILIQKLKQTFCLLIDLKEVRISHNSDWITVYVNDLDCLEEATKISSNHIKVLRAERTYPRGYIKCRHSQHKYRIYLRHVKLTVAEHNSMKQFIKTYSPHIFQSRVFGEWVADRWNRYRPAEFYFFFETNDIGLEHMLDLMVPGLKSRVCRIISDKYNTIEE